ncbi:30S ribosomal protein S9 [Candidatus Bathyarchaeota archaeon]|nr:30S ribosomal protein S9 [Candidatus Bathyarchaeota archaeon]MBT4319576.1 30S ribosomal protein S9 [Candidatus Bathyarchaeota archaeon]MBT4425120.1 30S ribosomal protein S9 [Candidatus Bathyarchaeota archaeon]MBT5643319.1 30S ribosomal protein S9 [Candidatus Bathyarchaeota archaeon]MBT6605897.1 30S ribosomal protein S9 [Candidatus Bathyarchaeota archaeon]
MSVKKKTVLATGKRKTSVARVVVSDGQGRIRVNNVPIGLIKPFMAREKIIEAFMIAGDYRSRVDIKIKTNGGGVMGQAEAARMGIAQGMVKFTKSKRLKAKYLEYDRTMLAGDARRKEAKKFGGPSARRKKQKSYR